MFNIFMDERKSAKENKARLNVIFRRGNAFFFLFSRCISLGMCGPEFQVVSQVCHRKNTLMIDRNQSWT